MMAKSKNKITLAFPQFADYAERLDKLGGDLKKATEEALQKSYDDVTPKLHAIMARHKDTGKTEDSIIDDSHVEWAGSVASIDVGFDIENGGLPSIFLMYGTPKHTPGNQYGTPRAGKMHPGTAADRELFELIYGSRGQRERAKIQEEVFSKAIKERMGG